MPIDYGSMVYTGPVDEFFGHPVRPAALPLAAVRASRRWTRAQFQPTGTVNYPGRATCRTHASREFKHLTGQPHAETTHRL